MNRHIPKSFFGMTSAPKMLAIASLCALAGPAFAQDARPQVGIATGQKTGTNWPMVEGIRKVCSRPGASINNVISDGPLDNIFKIFGEKAVDTRTVAKGGFHPKWKNVDPLDIDRIKWPAHPAAKSEILAATKRR